jgi:hypothetical protein
MKKFFIITTLILVLGMPLAAQEEGGGSAGASDVPFTFLLNFTNFGAGINLPKGPHLVEINGELLKIGLEHKATHFGLEFSPFKFSGWLGSKETQYTTEYFDYGTGTYGEKTNTSTNLTGSYSFSFINLTAFWNALGPHHDRFFIAPYASFNYLLMGESFYFDKFMLGAGLQSGIRGGDEKVKYNMFTIDVGFRLIDNQPLFCAGIKFDFIMHQVYKSGIFN